MKDTSMFSVSLFLPQSIDNLLYDGEEVKAMVIKFYDPTCCDDEQCGCGDDCGCGGK
jgi:hypothetical protein